MSESRDRRSIVPMFLVACLPMHPVIRGAEEFRFSLAPAGETPAASGDRVLEKTVLAGDVLLPVDVVLSTAGLPPDGPQGWTVAVRHDPSMALVAATLEGLSFEVTPCPVPYPCGDLAPCCDGIVEPGTGPGGESGIVSWVALNAIGKDTLPANASVTVLRIVYRVHVPDGETVECAATFLDGLQGTGLPVRNLVTFTGATVAPTSLQGLAFRLTGAPPAAFIRGDANVDSKVDIADAIGILYALFRPIPSGIGCWDSADVNADGAVDVSDPIALLGYQFLAGMPPPDPFPMCGRSPDPSPGSCPPGSTSCP